MRFVVMGIALTIGLAGCGMLQQGDPLADVPRLSDVAVADEDTVAIAAPEPAAEGGLFARIFGSRAATETEDIAGSEPDVSEDAVLAEATPAETPRGLRGLLARVGGRREAAADAPDTVDGALAALAPGDVAPLTIQPFGEVGRTCGLSGRDMGTEIAKGGGFTIYDTNPGSTNPRPHYVTGFDDRCARQFTAALVLTGDVGTHEIVRYRAATGSREYTAVDRAYEALKSGYCRAGFGKPCGARIDALARETIFVTGYQRFASSPTWVELLLHDGQLVETGVERR